MLGHRAPFGSNPLGALVWQPQAMNRGDFLNDLVSLLPSSEGGRLRIGIDGRDGVGKTSLAEELAPLLRSRGDAVTRASLDGFHNPQATRYKLGKDSAEGYWLHAYDLSSIKAELLDPWTTGTGAWRSAIHDVRTDETLTGEPTPVPAQGTLLVDGVFLARAELVEYWDILVLLDAPLAISQARGAARYGPDYDPNTPGERKYADAHAFYREACDPVARANILIDASDLAEPRLLRPSTVTLK